VRTARSDRRQHPGDRLCVWAANTQQAAPPTTPTEATDTSLRPKAKPAEPDDGLIAEAFVRQDYESTIAFAATLSAGVEKPDERFVARLSRKPLVGLGDGWRCLRCLVTRIGRCDPVGALSGPGGGEVVAVELGQVVGHHQ
jgi:hypothetical protein